MILPPLYNRSNLVWISMGDTVVEHSVVECIISSQLLHIEKRITRLERCVVQLLSVVDSTRSAARRGTGSAARHSTQSAARHGTGSAARHDTQDAVRHSTRSAAHHINIISRQIQEVVQEAVQRLQTVERWLLEFAHVPACVPLVERYNRCQSALVEQQHNIQHVQRCVAVQSAAIAHKLANPVASKLGIPNYRAPYAARFVNRTA